MGISTLVISDVDHFIGIKDYWDRELRDHVDDPFLFSCMLIEQWKSNQELGWHPFMMIFKSGAEIVGFAPLMLRTHFRFRQAANFDQYTCPDFFSDNIRETCVDIMISFLFRHLKCESANITLEDESNNQRMLEKVCRNKGFNCTSWPQEGQAIIPVETSLDSFRKSLKNKDRKKFEKISTKLDNLGSWQISHFDLDRDSIAKIEVVERFSWKARLEGREKALKDTGMESVLRGVQSNCQGESFFESEVWTLELNDVPMAYVLVMKRNKTVFFAKTSYDSRFKELSPGLFLMNDLIERVFKNMTAEKIDFISNMPFTQVWKPLVRNRITFTILRNPSLSKARHLVFGNPLSLKTSQILERIGRKKRLY
jgi:hypothetical protein